jgi:hypothetical protein
MQQCVKIFLFHIYMKLNMFRAVCAWQHPPTTRPLAFHGIMKNQRLPVQFQAPDDGRCVTQSMLSFI